MPAPSSASAQVVVIGAGISGLACAFRLHQLGVPVILLEAAHHPGGLIGTVEKDGLLFESGPQSFQGTVSILNLIRHLGIESELLTADPRAPRYVLLHGKLREIPMSPVALLTTSFLGVSSRWRIASEPFRKSRRPDGDESIADFVRRKFGHEILEYLVAPFVSGVYAGDPEKLSLRAAFPTLDEWEREHGSVLRGAMKSRPPKGERAGPPPLCSFRHGVSTLTRTIGERLGGALRTDARVVALHQSGAAAGHRYEIDIHHGGHEETLRANAVILSIPAYTAAHLLKTISSSLAQTLSGIAYAPVAVVAAEYHAKQIGESLRGFGFLVPRSEKLRTLGTIWNSSLFPGRAPEGRVAMTSFAGGATDPEIVAQPEEEIAEIVHKENARVLDISGPPTSIAVWRHSKALPQYSLGHGHIVRAISDTRHSHPGLFFAANYLEGPSLGKCVDVGTETADAVREYLRASS
jgi:protoporphyrinogen/coproporphyrinogen III oxidase